MTVRNLFLLALASTCAPLLSYAVPIVESRDDSVCRSGIYGELTPHLQAYQPALIFCSAIYPVSCTSKAAKRAAPSLTTTTRASTTTTTATASRRVNPTTTTTTTRASSSQDPKASALSKCQQQPWNVVSTLCSCIEKPTACRPKATTSSTTKASTQTSSTTTSSSSKATTTTTMTTTTSSSSSSTTSSTTTSSSSTASTSSTTTSSSTTTVSEITCPTTLSEVDSGDTYTVQCNFKYTYNAQSILQGLGGSEFEYCASDCSAREQCVAFSFSESAGSCNLYKDISQGGGPDPNYRYDSGIRVRAGSGTPT